MNDVRVLELAQIPLKQRSEKICKEYLLKDPTTIIEIPRKRLKRIISFDLAMWIVKMDFSLLQFLPKSILTVCFMKAVWKEKEYIMNFDIIFFLKFYPRSGLDRKFCRDLICVFPNPEVLQYIPEKFKTTPFWKNVLKRHGKLVRYIPEKTINFQLAQIAIENYPDAMRYIPRCLINTKLSKLSILKNPGNIKYAIFR